MDPCELNILIASITNHFHCTLKEKDFINLGVFLSLLSKDILAMAALEELLEWERPHKHHKHKHEHKKEKEDNKEDKKEEK